MYQRKGTKVLVTIASYGTNSGPYLSKLIQEYRRMRYDVHIVILSNIPKELGPGIEVVVGLPAKNPRSLPFGHKQIFADRLADYDLFIYSEDDTLIQERNIDAFLAVTDVLPTNEIAGFLRYEVDADGRVYFSTVHSHFHWAADSVKSMGEYTFAAFTNQHSGSFMLTSQHLRYAIESGGFLVEPHEGRYELLETAATDPYTQCGLTKMICISHLADFALHHLPNKYVGTMGLANQEVSQQIDVLLALQKNGHSQNGHSPTELFPTETKLLYARWSKSYYEPCRYDLLSLVPNNVRNVLSIGCGWGATEGWLVEKGIRVVGVPLDSVIASCAKSKGVKIVVGDFKQARKELETERFECILLSNVLHLVRDPVEVLSSFTELLSEGGIVLIGVPNFARLPILLRRMRGDRSLKDIGDYQKSGLHLITRRVTHQWLSRCQLRPEEFFPIVPRQGGLLHRLSSVLAAELVAEDLLIVGKRK